MTDLDHEKWFYAHFEERFGAIYDDEDMTRVMHRFGFGVFNRSCVLEGFRSFVLKTQFRGKRCVEIGTRFGLTAAVLAHRFDEVVTIDVAPNRTKHEVAEHLGLSNRIRFIDVADNAEKASAIKALDFDAAFVDGDHARDTASDFALVECCGHVLFHEHWSPQPAVMRLVDRLRSRGTVTASGKWALWRLA